MIGEGMIPKVECCIEALQGRREDPHHRRPLAPRRAARNFYRLRNRDRSGRTPRRGEGVDRERAQRGRNAANRCRPGQSKHDNAEIIELAHQHLINVYGCLPLAFVSGHGAYLYDADGNRYLDFFCGLAVTSSATAIRAWSARSRTRRRS